MFDPLIQHYTDVAEAESKAEAGGPEVRAQLVARGELPGPDGAFLSDSQREGLAWLREKLAGQAGHRSGTNGGEVTS